MRTFPELVKKHEKNKTWKDMGKLSGLATQYLALHERLGLNCLSDAQVEAKIARWQALEIDALIHEASMAQEETK